MPGLNEKYAKRREGKRSGVTSLNEKYASEGAKRGKKSLNEKYASKLPKPFGAQTLEAAKFLATPATFLLEQLGARIDATTAAAMDPITTKFSTGQSKPFGQSVLDVAKAPITGNPPEGYTRGDAAYEAGVRGGLEPWQARTLSIAGSFPAASGINKFGKYVALPLARGVQNAEVGRFTTRTLPGVRQVVETFGQAGATLPNRYREPFQRILRDAEGASDYRALIREKNLKEGLKLPEAVQNLIGEAIETNAISSLPSQGKYSSAVLQRVARAVVRENRERLGSEIRQGIERTGLARSKEGEGLGHVSRVLSKEGRQRAGLKPYGDPESPGFSTDPGKARSVGPNVTSSQLREAGVGLEPTVKATALKGSRSDVVRMKAEIFRKVDKQFGRAAEKGELTIADIGRKRGDAAGATTGFNKLFQRRFSKRALPPEIHQALARMNDSFTTQQWGKVSNAVRLVNNEFRRWALFSPGFISRNMQNNLAQNAIAGNHNPATWIDAMALRLRISRGVTTKADAPVVKELIERGVIGRGQIALESGTTGTSLYAKPFNAMRRGNRFSEEVSRMALYRHFRSVGKSADDAGREVNVWLGNYSPTFKSPAFTNLRRSVLPFINWRANVPTLFARAALERPGSFGQIGNVRNQLNAQAPADATAPPWVQGAVYNPGIPLPGLKKGTFIDPQFLGQMDFDEIADNLRKGPMGLLREVATNSYPQWQQFANTMTPTNRGETSGFSHFRSRPYDYPGGRQAMATAPAAFKLLAANDRGKRFLLEHGFEAGEDGTIRAPLRVVEYLGAFPQLRLAHIIADILKPTEGSEFRVKSFAYGIREYEARRPKK